MWYSEKLTPNVKFSIKVENHLFSAKSKFQQIDIFDSIDFGRFLTLDGYIMTTEKDEFIYHEMIVHVPMAVLPEAAEILVIGAGDGGVVRELTRYQTVKNIDLVEIDAMVIDVCKKYLPSTACHFGDGRVNIIIKDGSEYIKNIVNRYDLIIVDSTDPFGIGEALFTKEFYADCFNALNDNGALVNQHECPFYEGVQKIHKNIIETFPIGEVYQAHIPSYSSGHWLFGFASKKLHPLRDFDEQKWNMLGIETKYYNTRLHIGSFALPSYVNKMLRDAE